jgi:Ulp1 family protease
MDIERTTLKSQMIPFKNLCTKLNIEINHLNESTVSKTLREINFKEIFDNMPEQAKLEIGLKVNICTLCKVKGRHNRRTCPNRTSPGLSTSTIQDKDSSEIVPSNNKKMKSLVKTTKLEVKKMKFSETNSKSIKIQTTIKENDSVVLEGKNTPTSGHDIGPSASCILRDTLGFESSLTNEDKVRIRNFHLERGDIHDILVTVDNERVSRGSWLRLQPRHWLNDEVVNMFLHLISKREDQNCVLQREQRRSHYFSSFFFTKLFDEGVTNEYTYTNVKRWSRVRFQLYFTICFDILN